MAQITLSLELMKATSNGQGFYHRQVFIQSEYHKIMTSALLVVVMTGQNLKLIWQAFFWENIVNVFFLHDNNTNDNSDNNVTLFGIPKLGKQHR